MKPEERMALLKELVKIKTGTINESKRARALLRSLQGREVLETVPSVVGRGRPAIGRNVITTELRSTGKRPKFDISFFNRPDASAQGFTQDKPFKGGLKDSKSKALKYMLGTALDKDIPKNSTLKITPTDSRRAKAYQRMTGGALDFNVKKEPNYYGRLRDTFDDGASYKTKKGNFQPIVNNKFTKAKPNPKERLQKPLKEAAVANPEITRTLASTIARILRIGNPVNAIMTGADVGTWMRDNLKVNTQTSGRGGGRQALND